MKIYFSSDTHYFHDNIIKYCSRPFSCSEEMNKKMVENWNSVVGDEDIVFHVGDVSAGLRGRDKELREIISSLKGRKILIRGNHDHLPDQWYLDSGFHVVTDLLALNNVILSHFPISGSLQQISRGERAHVIHGHVHRTDIPNFEHHFNVAVDRNNFTPVLLEETTIPEEMRSGFVESSIKLFDHLP